jgi:hypothetical protein
MFKRFRKALQEAKRLLLAALKWAKIIEDTVDKLDPPTEGGQ